jgi:restriction system protein
MPEVTRRRTGELLRKLFEVLIKYPEGLQARDALAHVAASVSMTEHESGTYAAGTRRFEKIVRFATIDAVKAGWLLKSKGVWIVTEAGKDAHKSIPDPEAFYKQAVRLYNEWKASQPDAAALTDDETGDDSSGKAVSITFEEAEEQAWSEISQYLAGMKPYDFQELVASLLRAMGYHVSWVAPPGKDGGIDIVAGVDPLGTRPPRIKVQVKRQGQPVAVDGLRSFLAVLGENDVGLFVSTGGFTKDAAEEARTQEKRKITLVNMETLVELWIEHYEKLTYEGQKRLPLSPIYFLAPEQ